MHRSRLSVVVIDCAEEKMDAGVGFWRQALGMNTVHPDDPSSPYIGFDGRYRSLQLGLQRVQAPSRYHLDIETDDVDAEVLRLEGLRASRLEQGESWWVMEAPSGHRFCVVPQLSGDFPANTNQWDG